MGAFLQGYGANVVYIVSWLVDAVLLQRRWCWRTDVSHDADDDALKQDAAAGSSYFCLFVVLLHSTRCVPVRIEKACMVECSPCALSGCLDVR